MDFKKRFDIISRKEMWKKEEALSLDERRARYGCGQKFVTLQEIDTWDNTLNQLLLEAEQKKKEKEKKEKEEKEEKEKKENEKENENNNDGDEKKDEEKPHEKKKIHSSSYFERTQKTEHEPLEAIFAPNEELNKKISIWRGDICRLEIDAVVNAANTSLLGGGGIDGAIHRAAGDDLYNECKQLNGCATGKCKISRGYNLPAKFVLHTVGPIGEKPTALKSAYHSCLEVAVENGVRTLAFCGISTGIYGYPLYAASRVAIKTVRSWLEKGDNKTKLDRVIFCVFLEKEKECYEYLLPAYFPAPGTPFTPQQEEEEEEEEEEEKEEEEQEEDDENSEDDQQLQISQTNKENDNSTISTNQTSSPIDIDTTELDIEERKQKLNKKLSNRMARKDLIDRNIMRGGNLAPNIQAAAVALEKENRMLELQMQFDQRATREELIERNVIKPDTTIAPSLLAAKESLEKEKLVIDLEKKLENRPPKDELIEHKIIVNNNENNDNEINKVTNI